MLTSIASRDRSLTKRILAIIKTFNVHRQQGLVFCFDG